MAASRGLRLFLLLAGACVTARAHDVITTKVTWSREISRLVYRRCLSCHRDGGSSFSLATYAEARPWAKAIKEEVLERRMPPWGAVKGFGSFRDDQGLTQEDLELISDWVEGGAPEGDPALLPAALLLKTPPSAPPPPRTGPETMVDGALVLKHPLHAAAIRAKAVPEGGNIQVFAAKPDGAIEPLLWLLNYKPSFDRTYYFRAPLSLPAGTRIFCYPENAGAVALLAAPAPAHLTSAAHSRPGGSP